MNSDQPTFGRLSEFYAFADAHAHEYPHVQFLGSTLQKTRDRLRGKDEDDEAALVQIEVDALSFDLRGGDLASMFSGVDQDGNQQEYPDTRKFSHDHRSYLERRMQSTKSPALVARYAHILWKCAGHSVVQARQAIDSYLESVDLYKGEDERHPSDSFGLLLSWVVIAAFRISLSICDVERTATCRRILIDLVCNFNTDSKSRFNLVYNLTQFAMETRKQIPTLIDDLAHTVEKNYRNNYSKGDYFAAIEIAKLACRMPTTEKSRAISMWNIRIGDCYERLAKSATDPRNPVAPSFYADSIRHYKIGGASDKTVERLTKDYEEVAKQMQFGTVSTEVDLSEHIKECRRCAESVIAKGDEFIIQYMMEAQELVPSKQEIERRIGDIFKQSPLLSEIQSTLIDDFRQVQHFSEPNERRYFSLLQCYPYWLTTRTLFMLRELLFESIRQGVLTIDRIETFLRQQSWIALPRPGGSGDPADQTSWLEMVLPGIRHYFTQAGQMAVDASFRPNFTMVVDSLVPKIEGMTRELCASRGGTKISTTTDRCGRSVQLEKDLHSLLYEDVLLSLFDEDDVLFLRFLFVEQAGYNLRNRVAHGLTFSKDYTMDRTLLVLLALLRLARYQVSTESSS